MVVLIARLLQVIVRKNGDDKILLLCKGADTTVNARLSEASNKLLEVTCGHLNVSIPSYLCRVYFKVC